MSPVRHKTAEVGSGIPESEVALAPPARDVISAVLRSESQKLTSSIDPLKLQQSDPLSIPPIVVVLSSWNAGMAE
jgi:hypothetical protein